MKPVRRVTNKKIGELLIEKGIITQTQLDKGLAIQKEKGGLLGKILVDLGYAKEEEIAQALTVQYGFPFLPLENYEIDASVIKLVPENVARQYFLIPVDKIGDTITIAMADPLNVAAIEDIEMLGDFTVQVFVSTVSDIARAIDRYYSKKPTP
jgi:type IV pilus assembly protein PilB